MDVSKRLKQFDIEVVERRKDGGSIIINTGSLDRDRDRVLPSGARTESYFKNPVVQWGHNYRDPWAVIGRATSLLITPEAIKADFDLRPAANEQDPMNIIQLLWDGDWVRTSSIGFIPKQGVANAEGGFDFTEWELLEFSLVPIPANQDALRLAVKSMGTDENLFLQREVWDAMHGSNPVKQFFSGFDSRFKEAPEETSGDLAWVRQLEVDTNLGTQKLFAVYRAYTITVPKDATKLMSDKDNGIYPAPHPHAGKTLPQKEVTFIPPIEFDSEEWGGKDAIFGRSGVDASDETMAMATHSEYEIKDLSAILLRLPISKGVSRRVRATLDICETKLSDVMRAKSIITKRGRVLSSKNEATLRSAQEDVASANSKLADVLSQLGQAEETDADSPPKSLNGAGEPSPVQSTPTPSKMDNPAPINELAAVEKLFSGLFSEVKEAIL